MPDPAIEDPEEQPQQRRSFLAHAVRALVLAPIAFLVVMMAIALVIKRTHPSVGDEDSDELDLVTIFDGVELTSRATSFRGGSWTTMFGGGELDLREATLDPSGATLRVTAVMGGGDVKVPDGWNVELTSKAIAGGVGINRPNAVDDPYAPTLRVEMRAIMGGLGITSGE